MSETEVAGNACLRDLSACSDDPVCLDDATRVFPDPSSPDVQGASREFVKIFGYVPVRICGPAALMLGGHAAITAGVHVSASASPSGLAENVRFFAESDRTVALHARRLSGTLWISTGERAILETAEHARGEADAEFVMRALRISSFDTDDLQQAAGELGYSQGWRRVRHSIDKAPWGPTPKIAFGDACDSIWEKWTQKAISVIDNK